MNQRLDEIVKYTQLSKIEFAQRIGASKQEVSNWTSGTRISVRRIKDILDAFPKLNGHWFMTGEGKMCLDEERGGKYFEKEEPEEKSLEFYKKRIVELSEKLIESQEENIRLLKKNKEN